MTIDQKRHIFWDLLIMITCLMGLVGVNLEHVVGKILLIISGTIATLVVVLFGISLIIWPNDTHLEQKVK